MNVYAEKRKDLTVPLILKDSKGNTLVAQLLSCLFIVYLEVQKSGRYLFHGSYIVFIFYILKNSGNMYCVNLSAQLTMYRSPTEGR